MSVGPYTLHVWNCRIFMIGLEFERMHKYLAASEPNERKNVSYG